MIKLEIVWSAKNYIEEFGNLDNELIIHNRTTIEEIIEFILNGNHYDKKVITINRNKGKYYKAMDILGLYYEK